MEKALIAVDAGGTKTKVAVISQQQKIVDELLGGAGSPAVMNQELAFSRIFKLVEEIYVRNMNKYQINFIQMGISGLGVVGDVQKYQRQISEKLNIEAAIEDDGLLGLYSIVKDQPGEWIVVIAGTGSSCYGTNGQKIMLLGGFGHLLTEAGSAYASVKKLITDIIRQYEEKLSYSDLGLAFMKEIGIDNVYQLKVFMYNHTKSEIAHYARFITQRALAHDSAAEAILRQCGCDIARWVKLLYRHLHLSDQTVVGFRGSFINNSRFVKEALINDLNQSGYYPALVNGTDDPIFGAYYLALRKGKI